MKNRKLSILLVFFVISFYYTNLYAQTDFKNAVADAIEDGISWLKDHQHADGYFCDGCPTDPIATSSWPVGSAGLGATALMWGGVSTTDSHVCNALQYLIDNVNVATGGIFLSTTKQCYETSCAVLALTSSPCIVYCDLKDASGIVLTKDDIDIIIQDAVNYIQTCQWSTGCFNNGGFGYSPGVRADISLTQYAIWALCQAKKAGYNIEPTVWARAARYVLKSQDPATGCFSYIYSCNTSTSIPIHYTYQERESNNSEGLMTLWFCMCNITDPVLITEIIDAKDFALEWFSATHVIPGSSTTGLNYDPTKNLRESGGATPHYPDMLLCSARSSQYWEIDELPGAAGATHLTPPVGCDPGSSWFFDIAYQLLPLTSTDPCYAGVLPSHPQQPDGSWLDPFPPPPRFVYPTEIATSYALLTLERIFLPPYFPVDKTSPIVDWTVPCDCECVCCDTCEEEFIYICAHIQDGCNSLGINDTTIRVEIGSECCSNPYIHFSKTWIPDDATGTSGTVCIRVKCDSLCNVCPDVYNLSYKIYVCLWAEDIAGNELFPNPYTWSFTISKDRPWVEMYYPLCLRCEDYGPHIIWPQDPCCEKEFWDGYFRFASYHPCNLDCDTVKIITWTGGARPEEIIFTPTDAGIYYNEYFCTGELDSIKVDLIEALDLPWSLVPQSGPIANKRIYEVDTCFDSLRVCLTVCDESLDLFHLNADGVCSPETVVCHRDTCCWMFHNVHIYRTKSIPLGDTTTTKEKKIKF